MKIVTPGGEEGLIKFSRQMRGNFNRLLREVHLLGEANALSRIGWGVPELYKNNIIMIAMSYHCSVRFYQDRVQFGTTTIYF